MSKQKHEIGIREKANLDVKNGKNVRRAAPVNDTSRSSGTANAGKGNSPGTPGTGRGGSSNSGGVGNRNSGAAGRTGENASPAGQLVIDPAETKKKVYLFCVGVALMVANFTITIGSINLNILPGFIGCILFFPLAGCYCRESILARGTRVLAVPAAVYAAVVYFLTLFQYSEVSTTWWGIALSFFETSVDLVLCYLFLLSLHNTGAFRKNDVQEMHTAMVWFWLMAVSAMGMYFCTGIMAVVCRLVQCVAAILYAVFGAKAIVQLDKGKESRPGGAKSMKYAGRKN